jgi:hypothetical protein
VYSNTREEVVFPGDRRQFMPMLAMHDSLAARLLEAFKSFQVKSYI